MILPIKEAGGIAVDRGGSRRVEAPIMHIEIEYREASMGDEIAREAGYADEVEDYFEEDYEEEVDDIEEVDDDDGMDGEMVEGGTWMVGETGRWRDRGGGGWGASCLGASMRNWMRALVCMVSNRHRSLNR